MVNPLSFGINFAQAFGAMIVVVGIMAVVVSQMSDTLATNDGGNCAFSNRTDCGLATNATYEGTTGLSKFAQQQELIGLLGGLAVVIGILFFALGGFGGMNR